MVGHRLGFGSFILAVAGIPQVPAGLPTPSAPIPASARIAAHESEAVRTLRRIAAAEALFKAADDVDSECDGIGEYGYMAELAGSAPMRIGNSNGQGNPCSPGAGAPAFDTLDPPLLRGSFGTLVGHCALHDGYEFEIWLPNHPIGGVVPGIEEDFTGGKLGAPFPDPANGARMWCCYAWPIHYQQTGLSAFFIDQRGIVLGCRNASPTPFDGLNVRPNFDEVFSTQGDMSSPLLIGTPNARGNVWRPVR